MRDGLTGAILPPNEPPTGGCRHGVLEGFNCSTCELETNEINIAKEYLQRVLRHHTKLLASHALDVPLQLAIDTLTWLEEKLQ
jgi:hypothetical protein